MSNINTNSIDTSYPTPGINNSTQGFRDNFTGTKLNLDIAKTEISDLQSKVIVKSALTGIPLSNDMSNTFMSNAAVQGFRSTTYNLSDNISSSIVIDVTKADVHYGTITQNTAITFGGWSPSGTKSSIDLMLTVGNANAYISFPDTTINPSNVVTSGMDLSCRLVESYASNVTNLTSGITYTNKVGVPQGAHEVNFNINTIDCGTTLEIFPLNRNQQATQIPVRTPTATGKIGDVAGQVCADNSYLYVCVAPFDGSSGIWGKIALTGVT